MNRLAAAVAQQPCARRDLTRANIRGLRQAASADLLRGELRSLLRRHGAPSYYSARQYNARRDGYPQVRVEGLARRRGRRSGASSGLPPGFPMWTHTAERAARSPTCRPSVYCSLDSRLRNESGTPSPRTTGSSPTHRAAPRYIDMKRSRSDSKVFRLSPSRVVFTRWPEPVRHAS